ncbi:MAG: hypothetical protein KF753_09655 [Caldilineaceae bacterium]|nr:hypothetical protein [Caldilineaceae bacterium]
MDRFSWIVISAVGLLLLAAVGVATLRPNDSAAAQEVYLEQDTPDGVVHDAFVAFLRRDTERMKSYFSQRVRENFDKDQRWPNIDYYPDTGNKRMRIESVEMQSEERATVTIAIDNYNSGGLFSQSNVWTNRQTLLVVKEATGWKIDSENFYFY